MTTSSRWRPASIALSAALHGALVAAILVNWTRLGTETPNAFDIDLVMVSGGGDEAYDRTAPASGDSEDKQSAAAPPVAPTPSPAAISAPPVTSLPSDVAPPPVPPAPVAAPSAATAPDPSPSQGVAVVSLPTPPPPAPAAEPPKADPVAPEPAKPEPPVVDKVEPPPPPVVEPPKPVPPVVAAPITPPKPQTPPPLPTPAVKPPPPAAAAPQQQNYVDVPAPVSPSRSVPTVPSATDGNAPSSRGGSSAGGIALLTSPPPLYPADARERGEEGRVMVRATVSTDGTPQNVTVETSSGHRSLDAAAVDAVRGWRFRNNTGGTVDVTVPVRFALSDALSGTASAPPAARPSASPPAPSPAAPSPAAPPAATGGSGAVGGRPQAGSSDKAGPAAPGQVLVLDAPAPAYPPEARSQGIEGRVIVRAEIGVDGSPRNISIATGSGSLLLDQAAMEAVRKWRFRNSAGRAVEMTVPIRFVLRPDQ